MLSQDFFEFFSVYHGLALLLNYDIDAADDGEENREAQGHANQLPWRVGRFAELSGNYDFVIDSVEHCDPLSFSGAPPFW